jgi:hypothetical protein
MAKFLEITLVAGMSDAVPLRIVVRKGCLSHELCAHRPLQVRPGTMLSHHAKHSKTLGFAVSAKQDQALT